VEDCEAHWECQFGPFSDFSVPAVSLYKLEFDKLKRA